MSLMPETPVARDFYTFEHSAGRWSSPTSSSSSTNVASSTCSRALGGDAETWSPAVALAGPAAKDDGCPKLERQYARLACDLLASYGGFFGAGDHNAGVPALGAPVLERHCARLACDMSELQQALVSPAPQDDDAGLPKLERQCARLACDEPPVAPRYREEELPQLERQRARLAHDLPSSPWDPVVVASQEDRYPKLERQFARLACDVPVLESCRGSVGEDGFPTLERQFARLVCDLPFHA